MMLRILLVCLLVFTNVGGDLLALGFEKTPAANVSRRFFIMGTMLTITAEAHQTSDAFAAIEAAIQAFERINLRLSTWQSGSELSLLNRSPAGSWFPVTKELSEDLSEAVFWSTETHGAFHPGLGSLMKLWDLRGTGRIPTDREISIALGHINLDHLLLENNRAQKRIAEFIIEEGGFAKGRALREGAKAALCAGAKCIRFDFGGQIYSAGACAPTSISLADPLDRVRRIADINLDDSHAYKSSATSGLSVRHFTVGSRSFGHVLNPHTGSPLVTSMSVTVLGDDPVATDCLSTAFLVMGPEQSFKWLKSRQNFSAIFAIVADDKLTLRASANLVSLIAPYDPTILIDSR